MITGRNLRKVGLVINSSKTEVTRVITIVNQDLRLSSRGINRSSDFCYLGSVVYEDGGAKTDINVRIQKARG
jgi:hypothetical protein